MSRMRSLSASLAIALLVLACGGAASPTSRATLVPPRDDATPVVEVKVTPGLHEAEAADVCPAEFLEPCTEMYVATVESGFPGVVCIFPAGQWSIGTPGENGNGRRVGEACGTDGTGTIRAVLEGD